MKGCHYTQLFYPGHICLHARRWYSFEVDGRPATVAIDRHVDALRVLDFDNRINKDGLEHPIDKFSDQALRMSYEVNPSTLRREMIVDNYGKREHKVLYATFYTELVVVHEIANPASLTKAEEEFYLRVLEKFIRKYRYVSHDIKLRLPQHVNRERMVVKRGTVAYLPDELRLPVHERLAKSREVKLELKYVKFLDQTESLPFTEKEINDWTNRLLELHDDAMIREEEWLVKATEELVVNQNFRYALLDAFSAAESIVGRVLQKIRLAKGVSKKKLEAYEAEIGVGYMLNVELPSMLEHLNEKERQILGKVDGVRKLRNEVIHRGADVSKSDAADAIAHVALLIAMLQTRKTL